jgi:hypothetical protein
MQSSPNRDQRILRLALAQLGLHIHDIPLAAAARALRRRQLRR